jgi:hypothetical protein
LFENILHCKAGRAVDYTEASLNTPTLMRCII